MANEQQQTQPQVAIPLPKGKKNAVQIGCICMMLSVAMYGLVFATLTSPILESVNAMGYVSLFSIFAGMGVSIMTPIGGKLGDLIGRRNIVVIPGIICAVCGIAFALTITGIAESYRSVSITPSAQATLQPADMGVGTSLVNFVNSLANTIAATVFGVAYNLSTSADPTNVANIQNGVNSVFRLAAIVAVIGLVLVIFVVRPKMTAKKAE